MSLHDNSGVNPMDVGHAPAADDLVITAAEVLAADPTDEAREPLPTAMFNFIGGQVFVSDDYEPGGTAWQATGYWSWDKETPTPEVKELLIFDSALKYVEFKARA